MYLNIKSLNANINKLQILTNSLAIKPFKIVCWKTRNLEHYQYFILRGYNIHYNSKINQCDGTVVYMREDANANTEIITTEELNIINTTVELNSSENIELSALYKSHEFHKPEFVFNLKKYLIENKR